MTSESTKQYTVTIFRWGATAAITLPLLTGCAPFVSRLSDTLGGLSQDIWAIEQQHPVGSRELKFTNSDDFDNRLSASLRVPIFRQVEVTFEEGEKFEVRKTPGRIDKWLLKIDNSGGDIYRCSTDPNESSGLALAFGQWLWKSAYATWVDWETFSPAGEKHVELYVNAKDQKTVEWIVFKPREGYDRPTQCELNINS